MYEQQDEDQPEHNLRGVFRTDGEGRYEFYCLRPTPYPVSSLHHWHGLCRRGSRDTDRLIERCRSPATDPRVNCSTFSTGIIIARDISTSSYAAHPVLPTRVSRAQIDNDEQVKADGYKAITTQIFDRETPYLDNDSVFAVKDGLAVDFQPLQGDEKAGWQLEYNIAMAPLGETRAGSVPMAPTGAY